VVGIRTLSAGYAFSIDWEKESIYANSHIAVAEDFRPCRAVVC
jgi:hypothetical protein